MDPSCSGVQKRKADQVDDLFNTLANDRNYTKRKCVETENGSEHMGILCLPDDVLYIILSNLHPKDRLEMSLTCKRMMNLVNCSGVWKIVDCRPLHVNNLMFRKLTKFLSFGTQALSIRGYALKHLHADIEPTCTPLLLQTIKDKCTKIKILRIEEDLIQDVGIKDFPSTIEELSLAGSANRYFHSENSVPYFFRIERYLPNLTTLCLSQCRWFEPHALMILSKLPHLLRLDVSKCTRLGECVPYFSLAMRHGFKKLKVLDLRHTLLGDSEISCLKTLPCLTELLLECPSNVPNENNAENVHFNRNPVVVIRPLDRPQNENQVQQPDREDMLPLRMPVYHGFAHNHHPNIANVHQQQIIIHINRNFEHQGLQPELPQIHVIPGPNVVEEDQNPIPDAGLVVRDIILGLNNGHLHMPHLPAPCLITDRAICGFGNSEANNELNLIRIQGDHAAEEFEPLLERIVVRNYTRVTDRSLRHLANAIPRLKHLDVRGTTVTRQGIEKFMQDRPDCHIISDIDI